MKMFNVEKKTIEELVSIAKKCEGNVKVTAKGETFDLKQDADKLDVMTKIFSKINVPELNIHTTTPSDLDRFVNYLMYKKIA